MKIIEGNLDLDRLHLKELPEILSTVDKIDGYFSVSDNRISSLKNCPRIIGESVYFSYNEKLKNLVGGPEIVGKNYGVTGCKELTLEVGHYLGGTRKFPKEFTEDFFRSICDIRGKVKIYRWMGF